jgi:hypothetical protein
MGHCTMLLAVAGLDREAITEYTRALSSGDWSRFGPAERAAYRFARKLAEGDGSPAQDFQDLVRQFGRERAVDVLWWVCHCHYMTCVADAFQLPLESHNVFDGFGDPKRP